jgi:hypothetical protein
VPKSRSRRKPSSGQRRVPKSPKQPLVAQPAPGLRGEVERRSAPLLLWLSARPKFLVPGIMALLLIGGLAAPPGLGTPLLLVLLAFVGWLTYLSWPVIESRGRLIRVALMGLIVAAIVGKVMA